MLVRGSWFVDLPSYKRFDFGGTYKNQPVKMGSYKRSKSAVKQTTPIPVYCYEIVRLPSKLAMRGGDHL
jgi:hypothetical protein